MEHNLAKTVGTLIKAARKKRGLTQPQLAERIGKTYETISNIERGKKSPSIQTLGEISIALEVPVKDFFDDQLMQKQAAQNSTSSTSLTTQHYP